MDAAEIERQRAEHLTRLAVEAARNTVTRKAFDAMNPAQRMAHIRGGGKVVDALAVPGQDMSGEKFQRKPGSLRNWTDRASADFVLVGKIETLGHCTDDHLAALVRNDRGGYENLLRALAALVTRSVDIADAGTELHSRISTILKDNALAN